MTHHYVNILTESLRRKYGKLTAELPEGWLVGWLVVFNVPSTARSFSLHLQKKRINTEDKNKKELEGKNKYLHMHIIQAF